MSTINPTITDEMIERAAKALWDEPGWEQASPEQRQHHREAAERALEAAAPLIAAEAWEQGHRAANLEWEHVYSGHTVEPGDASGMCTECGQGNPYATGSADQIEAGR